jgi:beta-glucosidase/6-phospho-beta-glucosidase/beta-galactosidase
MSDTIATRDGFPEFAWAVGEEGSDPLVLDHGVPYRQDQFAQSGHYSHVDEDLRSIADLGVQVVRYGAPWRLSEPEPGRYDWTLWDRALALCTEHGLEPIVDLLHFGLPDAFDGFADPRWVDSFCRYVEAFLHRYQEPRWFTPINEPGVTAENSGCLGMWNDRLASGPDHARILANIVLANLEALDRIRDDRSGWWIGSEGFPVPVAVEPQADADVRALREWCWLVWDLHFGRDPSPLSARYLDPVDPSVLERIRSLAVTDRVVAGLDFYPTSVFPIGGVAPDWSVHERVAFGVAEFRRWHDRYDVPFWVGETSNLSLSVADQIPWLVSLTDRLRQLRNDGLPVRGLCWYSRGDQFDWQTELVDPKGVVTEVGLFDAHRRARPVADVFAQLASQTL